MLLVAAGGYYYYFYPPVVLKHATQHALVDFSKVVASKDRAKVVDSLKSLLSDSAKIRLEVDFLPVTGSNGTSIMAQDFDKPDFITFIDNTLYSLSDYSYTPRLTQFVLNPDRKTAVVEFTSQEWGEGMAYYGGMGAATRFRSDTSCQGEVAFEQNQVQLSKVSCKMQLRSAPKS